MPRVLPTPAAPMTRPSSTSGRHSPIGFSRSRNAMNMVRKPESQRGPQLARSANATGAGIRIRGRRGRPSVGCRSPWPGSSSMVPSPRLESTRSGSRIASTVASTKTAKPNRSDHSGPITDSAPAIGAATAAPTTPARPVRALALTSGRCSGVSRGTAAARVTAYALEQTRTPSAAGNSQPESVITAVPRTQQRNARRDIVPPMAHRRPWLKRSRNGPMSGATIAKGSIVRPRNSATWLRASPVGTWKNSVPASEIATAVSPAALQACRPMSRESPDSPAPSARAARRACWPARLPSLPVARAAPVAPLPTARALVRSPRPSPRPTPRPPSAPPSAPTRVPSPAAGRSPVADSPVGGCCSVMTTSCPMRPTVRDPVPRPDSRTEDLS